MGPHNAVNVSYLPSVNAHADPGMCTGAESTEYLRNHRFILMCAHQKWPSRTSCVPILETVVRDIRGIPILKLNLNCRIPDNNVQGGSCN